MTANKLHEIISGLHYRNVRDIEYLLIYPNENDKVMESSIDEEIQNKIDMHVDDDHDPNASCVSLSVCRYSVYLIPYMIYSTFDMSICQP